MFKTKMIRFYTPILILQIFCVYHAFKKNNEQRWIWIILFFPFFGSLIYLYQTFYSKRNLEVLKEGVKANLNSNYKIDKLEKEIKFSDTVFNRISLADEHLLIGNYNRAYELYKSCLEGIYKDDVDLLLKLVKVNYFNKNYDKVIFYGIQIPNDDEFKKTEEKAALAWAYSKKGNHNKANQHFKECDIRFSNYYQRLEYAKYLEQNGEKQNAINMLEELINEIDTMNSYEKKLKRQIYRTIKNYYTT
jgi:hypothetical protein